MKLNINEILMGFSTALDAVEGEIIGATSYHAQRVAYISSLIGRKLGLNDYERICLCVSAALHDNALTQFAQEEIKKGIRPEDVSIDSNLGAHCIMGEENVGLLTVYDDIKGSILYHHEKADGTGPFGTKPEDIPLYARIVHIADRVDVSLDFTTIDENKFQKVRSHIEKCTGTHYDREVSDAFLSAVSYDNLKDIEGAKIVDVLYNEMPLIEKEYQSDELFNLASMFARIIDFKSPFTTRHSIGIAQKAKMMGEHYGWDKQTCDKLFFAGAVHDVGKLFVNNDILEKPGKLTKQEFQKIQDHATGTYVVLKGIRGIEDITNWASLHHEKLDGSGYPFGKTADELDKKERLMACLDIYQALIEPRPYKEGMSHEKTMSILNDMVLDGKIDGDIVKDIDIKYKGWVEPTA